MGRFNHVELVGIVDEVPHIVRDNENAELIRGVAELLVFRATRNAHDGVTHPVSARPRIVSSNPVIISSMDTWQKNDIVEIRGILATETRQKPAGCCPNPNCKNNHVPIMLAGQLSYVIPIEVMHLSSHEGYEEAISELFKHPEISNSWIGIGRLTRDPKIIPYDKKNGAKLCQYQIAISRTFRDVHGDNPESVDYPWVKAYGSAGLEDALRLQENSEVLIDGFLQTRKVTRRAICPSCGEEFDWSDFALEIVPYYTEYLRLYRTKEEVEALKKEREDQSYNDRMAALLSSVGAEVGD